VASRYPLERLAELREQRAAGAALDLAEVLRGEAVAEAAVAAAREAVEAARGAARAVVLIGDRPSSATEVVRHEAYAIRLRRDVARAEVRLAEREAERAEWEAAVAAAREQATTARVEHQVVERHRERWETGEQKKRDRRED
jgi:hypothetical protein